MAPDSLLTGHFVFDEHLSDFAAIMDSIEDARHVALVREQGREDAAQAE